MLSFAVVIVSPDQLHRGCRPPWDWLQGRILSAHLQSVRVPGDADVCIAIGFRARSTKHTRFTVKGSPED